jgi:hypothetical protein
LCFIVADIACELQCSSDSMLFLAGLFEKVPVAIIIKLDPSLINSVAAEGVKRHFARPKAALRRSTTSVEWPKTDR